MHNRSIRSHPNEKTKVCRNSVVQLESSGRACRYIGRARRCRGPKRCADGRCHVDVSVHAAQDRTWACHVQPARYSPGNNVYVFCLHLLESRGNDHELHDLQDRNDPANQDSVHTLASRQLRHRRQKKSSTKLVNLFRWLDNHLPIVLPTDWRRR